jgi:hypothetical protein
VNPSFQPAKHNSFAALPGNARPWNRPGRRDAVQNIFLKRPRCHGRRAHPRSAKQRMPRLALSRSCDEKGIVLGNDRCWSCSCIHDVSSGGADGCDRGTRGNQSRRVAILRAAGGRRLKKPGPCLTAARSNLQVHHTPPDGFAPIPEDQVCSGRVVKGSQYARSKLRYRSDRIGGHGSKPGVEHERPRL